MTIEPPNGDPRQEPAPEPTPQHVWDPGDAPRENILRNLKAELQQQIWDNLDQWTENMDHFIVSQFKNPRTGNIEIKLNNGTQIDIVVTGTLTRPAD
jgi:hypothetical protein